MPRLRLAPLRAHPRFRAAVAELLVVRRHSRIMESSRLVFAIITSLANLVMCGAWWFAFIRLRHSKIFLALAILKVVAVLFDVQNLYLAFNEELLIRFATSRATLSFLEAISYVQITVYFAEAVCYVLLVRWLVLRFQTNQP